MLPRWVTTNNLYVAHARVTPVILQSKAPLAPGVGGYTDLAEGRQTFLGSFRFFGHLVWYVFAALAT